MGLKASLDAAAKAAVLTDSADLQGLVVLGELLRQLSTAASAEGQADLARQSEEAAALSESIILRQVDDVESAFRKVVEAIGACETAAERASAPAREPADPELLAAWIMSCESSLPELEHLAVTVETQAAGPTAQRNETCADLRRRIHTLKGECGVLSLAEAQALCHDLESLIDESTERFPVDPTLAVCDWMRTLILRLGQDASASEPDPTPVRRAIQAWSQGGTAKPTPAIATSRSASPVATATSDTPVAPAPAADPFADLLAIPADQSVSMNLEHVDENTGDFAVEAREHLANAENAVLSLEANTGDTEQVNVVFRAFHTIKGVSGFLNLPRIVEVAHAAEFLLDKVRSNKIPLSPHVLELVLASSDLIGQLIGMLSGGDAPKERELKILVRRLEAACEGRALAAPGGTPARVTAAPTATTDTTPNTSVDEGTSIAPSAAETKPAPTKAAAALAAKADQTVKVSTQRLDSLVNLVGELVIAQLMVVQDPVVSKIHDQRLSRNLAHLGKIVRDLQENSMSLRMVTLKSTFQKMARLVRDVAAKAGKRIQLEVEGEDVELDRTVVEEIGDPLVHMIRNACDHGVEPADERRKAGKNETGTLRLRAYHSGGSIVIEVEDDGRGLSRERILKKCLEKGLIDPSRNLAEIPDSEVFNYIFLPGFSTAEKVTDISGRGVGMDVVRRNIEALRGSVEIRSTTGKGSTFSMRLPLTMAIIDGMVVRVGGQRYIVPTLNIERSFRPTKEQLTMVLQKGELVRVREELLPIYRLHRLFTVREGAQDLAEGLLLVLEHGKRRACVFVDEILGQQQVVIKNLGNSQPQIRGVSGGAILGDGRVALIVDVGGLLESAAGAQNPTT
ncbi:MAG: chemotaxis protein CheA [Planctomycetota bacterium]|jgi:two-component system chemotaxis sensor kinase CheA